MALTKCKIGDLISVVDERNSYGITAFYGINIRKEFMPTAANTDGLDETKYKVVRKNRFVYSGMQTGRDECIRISMYLQNEPIIVSPAYTTFEVNATDQVIPLYFFMLFLSKEKDRLGWFYSDSSIRANLDWNVFCDIEIALPPVEVQQKYVEVYSAMLANQHNYECGLDNLKKTVFAEIDIVKHSATMVAVRELLEEIDVRNTDGAVTNVQGINIEKQFMPSVADTASVNLKNYKVVRNGQFAYSSMQTGRDECIRISLYDKDDPILISPAYSVMQVKDSAVVPEYIMLWFSRPETDRYGWFASDASIRANLDLDRFYEIQIPLPDTAKQQAIANIYIAYMLRREINEQLKVQIKDICPILIKGSIEEASA